MKVTGLTSAEPWHILNLIIEYTIPIFKYGCGIGDQNEPKFFTSRFVKRPGWGMHFKPI